MRVTAGHSSRCQALGDRCELSAVSYQRSALSMLRLRSLNPPGRSAGWRAGRSISPGFVGAGGVVGIGAAGRDIFPGEGYGAKGRYRDIRGHAESGGCLAPTRPARGGPSGVRALNSRRTTAVFSGDQRVAGTRRSRYLVIVGGHSARPSASPCVVAVSRLVLPEVVSRGVAELTFFAAVLATAEAYPSATGLNHPMVLAGN